MARYKPPDDQKITRIDRDSSKSSAVDKIKRYYDQQIQKTPVRRPAQKPAERGAGDKFHMNNLVPKFLKSVQKRLESGWIYRSFKLPGTNYLVRDLRDQKDVGQEQADAKRGFELKDGQLAEAKKRTYENYLGERQFPQAKVSKDAAKQINRLLSEFEKTLVERFEKGKTLEQQLKDGKPVFKLKSDGEWKAFFAKFLKRSVWKQSDIKLLKSFIFRGALSLKKGDGKFAMLIGDMAMQNGQVQKFTRLKVLSTMLEMLANMEPGSSLEADQLKEGLDAEAFRYLALASKHSEKAIKTGMQTSKGVFGELKTEEEIAEKLGLRKKKGGGKGYGGPIKWGEEGGSSEEPHSFVPWGFWNRDDSKKRPSLLKFIIISLLTILVLTGMIALFSSLF